MPKSDKELFSNQLRDLLSVVRDSGIRIDGDSQDRLLEYCLRVATHASTHDLVSLRDVDHLVTKHVAASIGILGVEAPQPGQVWIDAGTGGGFPGMVVKICRPDLRIALLDSSRKKTAFLSSTAQCLGLDDLDVICSRMEEPFSTRIADASAGFDVILMRAVAPLARAVEWANALCHPGSGLLVFKGPQWKQEVDESLAAIERAKWIVEDLTQIPWAQPKILRLRKH
jgi:16S rRNA (guanine527-N7)-methyltransferase